jgi:hypothetical protein
MQKNNQVIAEIYTYTPIYNSVGVNFIRLYSSDFILKRSVC